MTVLAATIFVVAVAVIVAVIANVIAVVVVVVAVVAVAVDIVARIITEIQIWTNINFWIKTVICQFILTSKLLFPLFQNSIL